MSKGKGDNQGLLGIFRHLNWENTHTKPGRRHQKHLLQTSLHQKESKEKKTKGPGTGRGTTRFHLLLESQGVKGRGKIKHRGLCGAQERGGQNLYRLTGQGGAGHPRNFQPHDKEG